MRTIIAIGCCFVTVAAHAQAVPPAQISTCPEYAASLSANVANLLTYNQNLATQVAELQKQIADLKKPAAPATPETPKP
jgi:hypothetical protein